MKQLHRLFVLMLVFIVHDWFDLFGAALSIVVPTVVKLSQNPYTYKKEYAREFNFRDNTDFVPVHAWEHMRVDAADVIRLRDGAVRFGAVRSAPVDWAVRSAQIILGRSIGAGRSGRLGWCRSIRRLGWADRFGRSIWPLDLVVGLSGLTRPRATDLPGCTTLGPTSSVR